MVFFYIPKKNKMLRPTKEKKEKKKKKITSLVYYNQIVYILSYVLNN